MRMTMPCRATGRGARRLGGVLLGSAMLLAGTGAIAAEAPITIVINESPWFNGFACIVDLYEDETGNSVDLDVNPFAGSLEKQRNSVRASSGLYDILIMNSGWYAEMYHGGFVEAITDIDPDFQLDPQIFDHDNTIYFDEATKTSSPETGKLMSMPVNPNIPLLIYREDLYEEHGLSVPETFEELYENARVLHNPPEIYGIVQRGARGPHSVAYDWYPYLYGFGGSIFQDQENNDFTVTINSPEGKEALDFYIKLAEEVGHPNTASQDQSLVIQAMATGRAAHIITVIAAWPQFEDPARSAVVDKLNLALPPHAPGHQSAPGLGHWLAGISKNVPEERQRAAVAFFEWFQTPHAQTEYAKCGGAPVSAAAYETELADERENRWMAPMQAGLPLAVNIYTFPEAAEVIAILELELNRAIAGEISTTEALNTMADQIHQVMDRHGYQTGLIDPLP